MRVLLSVVATASLLTVMSMQADAAALSDGTDCLHLPPPTQFEPSYSELTLRQAILMTLKNNQTVEDSQLSMASAKENLDNAYFTYEPQMSINGTASISAGSRPSYNLYTQVNLFTPIGTSIGFEYTPKFLGNYQAASGVGTIVMSQPLLRGFGLAYNTTTLTNQFASFQTSALTYKSSMMSLVSQTISNYYDYLVSLFVLEQTQLQLENARQAVDNAKQQVSQGQLSVSQLTHSEASLAQQQLSYKQQENTVVQNRQTLLTTLGIPFNTKITMDRTLPDTFPAIKSYLPYYHRALQHNIGVLQARAALVSARNGVITARNERKWTLTVNATVNVIGKSIFTSTNTAPPGATPNAAAKGANLQLTIPISQVDLKAALIESEVALAQAQINLAQVEYSLRQRIKNDVINLNFQREQILVNQQQILLTTDTVRAAEIRLAYGQEAALEMYQYRLELTNAQINLGQSKISYIESMAQLLQDTGDLLNQYGIVLKY